jgi:hypothetical protein
VRRFAFSAAGLAVCFLGAGCGGGGGQVGLSANAASFDRRIAAEGTTLRASGHNCSGLYGRWSVRLELSGTATGSGETKFTLARGEEATAPISFAITAAGLSGRAIGLMRVAPSAGELLVRGRVEVNVAFRTLSRRIAERVRVERGPTQACGLSG